MQLVERAELLARLGACLDDAYAGGRLALIGGEAGVGKTSLVRAFVEARPDAGRAVGRVRSVVDAEAACPVSGTCPRLRRCSMSVRSATRS